MVGAAALVATMLAGAGARLASVGDVAAGEDAPAAWEVVLRDDFSDDEGFVAFQSPPRQNAVLRPGDSRNKDLQRPTLRSNAEIAPDPDAEDGWALGVHTRRARFETPGGERMGWTNGRIMLGQPGTAPPVRVRARLRLTPSALTKSATMWWPASGQWTWEVDFVETFGGRSLDDYWGGRQHVAQRWHADLDGDGRATEELAEDVPIDATRYRIYDLVLTESSMSLSIDGAERMRTDDVRFLPQGPGVFTVGTALTGRRDAGGRTPNAVHVDWVEILRPSNGAGTR